MNSEPIGPCQTILLSSQNIYGKLMNGKNKGDPNPFHKGIHLELTPWILFYCYPAFPLNYSVPPGFEGLFLFKKER